MNGTSLYVRSNNERRRMRQADIYLLDCVQVHIFRS
jgi:hypothetical protein